MNYLKNGDCLELMRELKDSSVDLILCDLPIWDNGLCMG